MACEHGEPMSGVSCGQPRIISAIDQSTSATCSMNAEELIDSLTLDWTVLCDCIGFSFPFLAFNALTLLVGRQEERPSRKKTH